MDETTNDENVNGNLSIFSEIFPNVPKIERIESSQTKNDLFFRCEICIRWFGDIDELFLHIMEEHQHIKISDDIQNILYTQWEKMLKMERTIIELVSKNRFKSARKHLKSSLVTLNGIITNIFSLNDNIFKYFISSMRPRIKSLIREAKALNKIDESKNNISVDIRKINGYCDKALSKQGKKRKKKSRISDKMEENGYSSGFSSDDNLCLKDAIKRLKTDVKSEDSKTENPIKIDECLKKVTYYIIPEKCNKCVLSLTEKERIRSAIRDILKNKHVDMSMFNDVLLKRFDLEEDEIVPDDAFLVNEWILDVKKETNWEEMSLEDFLLNRYIKKNKNKKIPDIIENNMVYKNKSTNTRCDICSITLVSKYEYKMHMINIHHSSDFRCEECGELFLYKKKLIEHSLQHNKVDGKCEVCHLQLSIDEKKHEHLIKCKSNYLWLCIICIQKFPTLNRLRTHCKLVHAEIDSIIEENDNAPACNLCSRKFTSMGRLLQHIAVIHEGKAFRKKKK